MKYLFVYVIFSIAYVKIENILNSYERKKELKYLALYSCFSIQIRNWHQAAVLLWEHLTMLIFVSIFPKENLIKRYYYWYHIIYILIGKKSEI